MKFPRTKAYGVSSIKKVAASFYRMNRLEDGIVLFYQGRICGWKNTLRNPEQERPNVLAVDFYGNIFMTAGGDEYHGAEEWRIYGPA